MEPMTVYIGAAQYQLVPPSVLIIQPDAYTTVNNHGLIKVQRSLNTSTFNMSYRNALKLYLSNS